MTKDLSRSLLLLCLLSLGAAQCDPPVLSLKVGPEQVLALEVGENHLTSWLTTIGTGAPTLLKTQRYRVADGATFTVDVDDAAGIYLTTHNYKTVPAYQLHFRGRANNMTAFAYTDFEDQAFAALRAENNPLPLSARHGDFVDLVVPLNYAIERWQRLPNSLSAQQHDTVLKHYTTWQQQHICSMDLPPAFLRICEPDTEDTWAIKTQTTLRRLWQAARPKHAKLLPMGEIEHVLTPMDDELSDWLGACYEQSRWNLSNDRTQEEDQALVETLLACLYTRIKRDWSSDDDAQYVIDSAPIGAEALPTELIQDWRQPATDVQGLVESVIGGKMFLHSAPATDTSPCLAGATNLTVDIQGVALVVGTPFNDHIIGGNRTDDVEILLGGSGQDCIEGRRGDEIILGGAGADTILGGAHQELIAGDGGDDVISAGRGTKNDRLYAGSILLGDEGKDKIQGSKPSFGTQPTGFSDVIHVEDGINGRGGADLVIGLNAETNVEDLDEQVDLGELLSALEGDGSSSTRADADIADALGDEMTNQEAGGMRGLPGGAGGGNAIIRANTGGSGDGGAQFVDMPGGANARQSGNQVQSDFDLGGGAPDLALKVTEEDGEAGKATVVVPVGNAKQKMSDALSTNAVLPPVDYANEKPKPTMIEIITGKTTLNKLLFPKKGEGEDGESGGCANSPRFMLFLGIFVLWWLRQLQTAWAMRNKRKRQQQRMNDTSYFTVHDDE